MPLRDLLLTTIIFGSVPAILRNPYWGVLMWNWLAFMSPHRYTWEFAQTMRFSLVVAASTLLSFVIYKGKKAVPWRAPMVLLVLLFLWVCATTVVAMNPTGAQAEWERFTKIIVMVVVASALLHTRDRIEWLIVVIVLSLGFYGFKGGIFTIAHGGQYRVGGPPGSFIAGNNELAFALIIMLPLARYLQLVVTNPKVRWGITVLMVLCGFSIVGSYSRGAFLAGGAMAIALWLRSRRKVALALAMAVAIPLMYSFMPQQWHERMGTIENYQQDASAMGRINAWKMAWNLALDNPVFGAGARAFTKANFWRYAPNPRDVHDAHSIYFEMLAEQGFVGLGLFLLLGIVTLWTCSWLMKAGKLRPELHWAYDLGAMCQTSLVGYAVGGAFLGLSYWDLPYTIVAIVAAARVIVERELAGEPEPAPAASGFVPGMR